MTTGQKRKQMQKRRKQIRRMKRRARMWAARLLALSVFCLLCFGVVRGGTWLWGCLTDKEESIFHGARIVEPAERKPGSRLIVLDAGHGGRDQGTSAGEVLEKDINLAMVKILAEILEEAGETVVLTREDDTKIGLEDRARFANEMEADLFVSLHCNYCEEDPGVRGLECYYREDSGNGKELADQIVEALGGQEEIDNRGTRTANFRVLCKTDMPAVLVEMGYLSNQSERRKMTDEGYQKLLAQKLAEGILASGSVEKAENGS